MCPAIDLRIVVLYQYSVYITFIHFSWLFFDTNFCAQLVTKPEFWFEKNLDLLHSHIHLSRKLKSLARLCLPFLITSKAHRNVTQKKRNISLKQAVPMCKLIIQ